MDQANAQKDNGEREGSEGMTADEYKRIMDKLYQDLQEIIKRYEAEEISAEEYTKLYAEIWDQHVKQYGVENLKEGQRQFIIQDIRYGREERHEAWIKKYQEWYGRGEPLSAIQDPEELRKAIDRINAIPSEFEIMLFLRSENKILYDQDRFFTEAINRYDGIDICFMDQEEPDKGLTNLAGVDVKNTGDYQNFQIETEKKYHGVFYSEYAWARHVLTGKNRYVAYVRGGQKYGGKLASETEAFSLDKSEREIKRDLIGYYYHNRQLLDHDIEIIRGEDIRSYLEQNGTRGRAITTYMKGHNIPFHTFTKKNGEPEHGWIDYYNFPALRVRRSGGGWIKEQMNTRNPLEIQTIKYRTLADMSRQIQTIRDRQANGVTIQILQTLFGLPDPILSDEEIREKVSDLMFDDMQDGIIEEYIRQGKIMREDLDY